MTPQGPPITPAGMAALKARYDHLLETERPAIVEIVSWAAGNGDRSENGDYIYGRKKMREIDRELAHLIKRMKTLRVVNPAEQIDKSRVFFGARVTIADEDDNHQTIQLVGDDEQEASEGRIGWHSPLARALRGSAVGDVRIVTLPSGTREWEVLTIAYA
ncbi:GreA/GreB family elongation factor [Erythrobacter sp. R86502]|uniref:GreA/GreB family elongation factor n=1 Tax=Erythrobacter sp. R86502 TaxID=3093846 RepID=UPI0036D26D8A